MPPHFDETTLLRAPAFSVQRVRGAALALDPAAPNWLASDERGVRLLGQFDGRTPFADVVTDYARQTGLDGTRAWLHVETFARDALRQGFLSTDGAASAPYLGRQAYLELDALHEFWIQVNDFCNLACEHCLVSSGPQREQGLETGRILDAIDQAVSLGALRVFFTGGEPLARPDILELCGHVVERHGRELVILTNGTSFKAARLARLVELAGRTVTNGREASPAVRVQISLDGATAEVNDPIRGAGSFIRIVDGIRTAVEAGLRPTLTTTILRHNLGDLDNVVRLAAELGVRNVHLLWLHRRGRVLDGPFADLPPADEILTAVRSARRQARELDVSIDNMEEFGLRLDGTPGVKNDLAGAGWSSLCLYTDGGIYPSASMAGVDALRFGNLAEQSLERIWKESPLSVELRAATVERKPTCRTCELRFLCGGGDLEHGYWASAAEAADGRGSFLGHTTRIATSTRGWPGTRLRSWPARAGRRSSRVRASTAPSSCAGWGSGPSMTPRRSCGPHTLPACSPRRCWSGPA